MVRMPTLLNYSYFMLATAQKKLSPVDGWLGWLLNQLGIKPTQPCLSLDLSWARQYSGTCKSVLIFLFCIYYFKTWNIMNCFFTLYGILPIIMIFQENKLGLSRAKLTQFRLRLNGFDLPISTTRCHWTWLANVKTIPLTAPFTFHPAPPKATPSY